MSDNIQYILNDENTLLLTVEQVSKILRIGRSTTYELVNNPNCPFVVHRIGKTIRVEKESFLKSLKTPIAI